MTLKTITRTVVCAILPLFLVAQATGQEFAREISQFVGENARPFLQPVVDALHSNVHAGLFVPVVADGIHIGIQAVLTGITIPDERKTFRPTPYSKTVEFTRNGVTYLGDLDISPDELPTAAGLDRRYTFTGRLRRIRPKGLPYVPNPVYDSIQQDASVTIGGYKDLSTVVLGTPQLTVGSVFGTELIIRILPKVNIEDVGDVNSFGIGMRHLVSRYVDVPFDIAASFMYQTLTLSASDEGFNAALEISTFSGQLCASKNIPLGVLTLIPYAGFGFETGSIDVRYDFADPYIDKQQLTFDSGMQTRFIGGLSASVWKVRVNADYNIGLMNGFSIAVGVEWP
ncbi:MAG: hypothetical protein KF749_06510 [Bacteroidetes bacterium]|nr:hypothetical protein [Bacteroidota bacterium]MCW5896884.1 hypothetical protein [Bacteroidota bacterium]